jgi:hypothetical protein
MSREHDIVAEYQRRKSAGEGGIVDSIADAESCSREAIYLILRRHGLSRRDQAAARPPSEPRPPRAERKPRILRPSQRDGLARFTAAKAEPERTTGLADDHPAVVEGHTLFSGNVVQARQNPRLLVSGENNPKTGARVDKGQWAGFPIYTLTLEERATCPRGCSNWQTCYGNAMHWPRRADASDPDFIGALAAEVTTTARRHPQGLVIRLHVLGDFFSSRYVLLWAGLLQMFPNLHVFGYTGRRSDDAADPASARIGRAVEALRDGAWGRFAVRTSHTEAGPRRAIVVEEPTHQAGVITCPAQLEATATCGTCALCWSAPDKTIAFIRHGIKHRTREHNL